MSFPPEPRGLLLLLVVWTASQLWPPSAADPAASPRIIITSSSLGEKRFHFGTPESHIVLYHEQGTPSVFVGAESKLYYHNFDNSTDYEVPFKTTRKPSNCKNEDDKNYLTLLEKYQDKLLICGTNACNPTCWNWVHGKKEIFMHAQGLAPFGLDPNALVLVDGDDIYSTIKKHQYNGKNPRFRRILGSTELYTTDMMMKNPQFVKAAMVKQDKPYNAKIYLFFREDNPDSSRNPVASKSISRVAQLCKGDKGGSGSLSASKWTTFLKATLLCVDGDRHFNHLQDVFIVESPVWSQTKIYGLFSNEWEYSAVCVYSVGAISEVFRTSPLKGYTGEPPAVRPGQCLEGDQRTPHETFQLADSYPEVLNRVQEKAIFSNKHHYQQIEIHQVEAGDGVTYNVLYLATDRGTIHKVVVLPTGAINVLEIQPFQSSAVIQSMILDTARKELFVASLSEVVQLPLAMCGAYKNTCGSCVLARDPYCGWTGGKCDSVYDHKQNGNRTLLQALTHDNSSDICSSSSNNTKEDGMELHMNVTVPQQSRYYLNCTVESHHANYTWFHNNRAILHCRPGHRHCIYFIDNMTDDLYGTYSCIAKEDWFTQTLVTENLVKPFSKTIAFRDKLHKDTATTTSLSFWLGLLHMLAVVLVIQ
ncbi:semaphorin-7A isoform X1 [Pogona vitticeps]